MCVSGRRHEKPQLAAIALHELGGTIQRTPASPRPGRAEIGRAANGCALHPAGCPAASMPTTDPGNREESPSERIGLCLVLSQAERPGKDCPGFAQDCRQPSPTNSHWPAAGPRQQGSSPLSHSGDARLSATSCDQRCWCSSWLLTWPPFPASLSLGADAGCEYQTHRLSTLGLAPQNGQDSALHHTHAHLDSAFSKAEQSKACSPHTRAAGGPTPPPPSLSHLLPPLSSSSSSCYSYSLSRSPTLPPSNSLTTSISPSVVSSLFLAPALPGLALLGM